MQETISKDKLEMLIYMVEYGYTKQEIVELLHVTYDDINYYTNKYNVISPLINKKKNGLYFCPICKTYKEPECFHKYDGRKYGIYHYCKECRSIYRAEQKKKKYFAEIDAYIESIKEVEKTKEEVWGSNVRQCSRCKEIKDIEEFSWQNKYIKVKSECKECTKIRTKEYLSKRAYEKGY